MISWIFDQILPLSVLLGLLLVTHKVLLNWLGGRGVYLLWAVVPVLLLMSFLPESSSVVIISVQPAETYALLSQRVSEYSISNEVNWLLWSWGLIAVGMVTYLLYSHLRYLNWLQIQPAQEMKSNHIDWPQRIPVKLSYSKRIQSPLITGLISHRLVLPSNFSQKYSDEQRRLIVKHELCHLKRGDLYWNLLAIVVLTVFWFHPLCWLAYVRFRQDQELACDEQVLMNGNKFEKRAYAEALLMSVTDQQWTGITQLHYGNRRSMMERMTQVGKSSNKSVWYSVVLIAVTLMVGWSVGYTMPQSADESYIPTNKVVPKYPAKALRQGVEGYVIVEFTINEAGETENHKVLKSKDIDGNSINVFNDAALEAAKKLTYKPKILNGQAVKAEAVLHKFTFELQEGGQGSLPIVKIAPQYPGEALKRKVQGYVVVEFTVDEKGQTLNHHVVEGKDVNGVDTDVFNEAAIRAAQKLKFKPRIVDGKPVEVRGVSHKFTFELDK